MHGSRQTLLTGQALLFVAFLLMLLIWKENISYWEVAIPYVFLGIGIGLAGTPSSNSLTGSVPVTRVGMASGTADLQRDLGGALMTSIFGALLTAGYASAMDGGRLVHDPEHAGHAAALLLERREPRRTPPGYASQITAAAQSSFLKGDQWAYLAAMIAVLIGMALVFRFFPKKDEEEALRAAYAQGAGVTGTTRPRNPRRTSRPGRRGRRAGPHPLAAGSLMSLHLLLADSGTVTFFKGWDLTGNFTAVDLVAASTNALNGALLARRPDHFKNFTIVGILGMALLGGLGGGITRDVMLGDVPSALTNPAYITLALAFGIIGYNLAYAKGQLFREGLFQFMTSFSLPWYAIVGAQKGIAQGHPRPWLHPARGRGPDRGSVVHRRVERRHPEAVHPRRVVRLDRGAHGARLDPRLLGGWQHVGGRGGRVRRRLRGACGRLWYAWEEPLASEPTGVYQHSDGRPMLGRKLAGKSQRELRDLGLVVEDGDQTAQVSVGTGTD